jgi:hypothetical protein
MPAEWPALPYDPWSATCDTLHAHTQLLGKLAAALAPPEPQLQHAALRLTVRGWETLPLPAPDGSGALAVALDLRTHQVVAEHSDGRAERVALTPDRPVADVTREVLAAVRALAGPMQINPRPQEVPWRSPLDQDEEHATYDPRARQRLFRGGDPGGAGPVRAARAVPWALQSGQRVVGLVRPGGEPILRPSGRARIRRFHHA